MNGTNGLNAPLLSESQNDYLTKDKAINDTSSVLSEQFNRSLTLEEKKAFLNIDDDQGFVASEDPTNHIAISKQLFDTWRFYRILYSFLAVLAIIPAAIDYESRYSDLRKINHCVQNQDVTNKWRVMALILSFAAVGIMILYRINFFEWKRHHPKTFKDLPPMKQYPLIEYLNLRKPFKISDYIGDEVPLTVFLLILFPYPFIDFEFIVPQQMSYEQVDVCYYFSEVLYAIMYLRTYLLVTGIFNYGNYFNPIAMRIGEKHGVRVTSNFAIKCYVNRKPLLMLLLLFLIPAVFVFGLLMRIFERPLMSTSNDFDYVGNAWWNIIITMTTVGYGDTYPSTNIGRVIVAISAFWGGIILSLTFSTMSTFLQLKSNEQKALNSIIITNVACDAISSVVSGKKLREGGAKNLWGKVRERLIVLKEYRSELLNQDQLTESTEAISIRLYSLEKKSRDIEALLEELHNKVDSRLE